MEKKVVIIDADFLSSFFKIDRIYLIFDVLGVENILVSSQVLDEIKQSYFYAQFLEYINKYEKRILIEAVNGIGSSEVYGRGELSCIALAKKISAPVLMDDFLAKRFAENQGLIVIDIPGFLFYAKSIGFIGKEDIKEIIKDLK